MPKINFPVSGEKEIILNNNELLSEALDVDNSPLLFGCRTGVCGTCLIEILQETNGHIAAPNEDEKEYLEIVAPNNPKARLACQIKLTADIQVRRLEE